jgi:hypothetical protein
MSKKSVRVRNSFSRRWAAVISGSLFFVTAHSAVAAHEDRPRFREFRQENAGIDRSALRKMYHQQFGGGGRASNPDQVQIPTIPTVMPEVSTPRDIVRVTGVTRRLEKRLERQGIINQSVQQIDNNLINIRGGVNLDLTSATRNITLGNKLFDSIAAVEISVGGEAKTVQAGSQVSAAEYIAVKQILSGHSQKITIDTAGAATGGEVDLGSITANNDVMRASDLVVPVNVTTYGDFSKRSDFKLLGDLTNSGTVHTYSSHKNGGAIRADDITNQAGALISSDTDLGLFASGNLSNYGTITSKGSLTLSAGNTLTNASEVTAKGDVNLNAPTIVNSGSVTSLKGDINIDGPSTAELNVNGAGGTFTADNAINVRSADYAGAFNTNVNGGDFYSKEMNLNAGGGVMQTHVGELTGVLNQTGTEAHVTASTDNLVLGGVCLTGDPTFKNDSGNIIIAGNITVAESLAIIASGNISSVNNISIIAGAAATGFPITMVAGADQIVAGTNSGTLPGGGVAQATSLTGLASATGGSVLLGNNVTVSSRATGATGAGGNVLIAAFEGGNAGSGRVNVGGGTTTINTGGRTAADANGDVTIIAGRQFGNSANIGFINTTGGNTSTGVVRITTTQPISSDGNQIDYNANGAIISGNGLIAGPGIGDDSNVTFVRNVLTNVDVFVDSDTITTLTGSSVTSNFGTINFSSIDGIFGAGVGSLVAAPTVNLVSQNTDIGAIGTRVRVDANSLYVDAPLGSVYVQDIDEVDLLAATVQGDFNILAQGTLSNSGAIAGNTVTLRSSGGNINVINTITGVSAIDLRASFNVEGTAQITTPTLSVTSDLANIGSVSSLIIDVDDLRVTAPNGNATLVDLNSVNLGGGATSVFGTLNLTADFGISNTSDVTANIVNLTATNGVFTLGGGTVITGLTAINLNAGQSIQNVDLGALLVSPSINLTSFLANIGTNSAIPLNLDVQNVTLNAVNGNVWFSDPTSANFGPGGSNALGTFQATAANNLTSTGTIFGTDVILEATNGSFDLDGAVSGTNSIKLTSFNSIGDANVSGGLNNGFAGPVANLDITSTNGDIGAFLNPLDIDADNLTFNTPNGSAFIRDTNSVTVLGNSFSQFNIGLTAVGSFTNVGTIESGNGMVIVANAIDVQNTLTGGGSIDLLSDTTITTSADIDSGFNATLLADGTISTTGNILAANDATLVADGTVNVFGTLTAGNSATISSISGFVTTFDTIGGGNFTSISGETGVTTLGAVSATLNDVTIIAANGPVQVVGSVTAGTDINVTAEASSVQVLSPLTAGNTVAIEADTSISTAAITATAGDVFITGGTTVDLLGPVSAGVSVFAGADGNLTSNDTITAQDSVDLSSGNDLAVNGTVTAVTGSVNYFADNDVNSNGTVNAGSDFTVFAGNDANLSDVNAPGLTDVFAVNNINSFGTITGGTIFLQADNTVQTLAVTATGDLTIDGENGVTTNGAISADEIFFYSDLAGVQLNNPVTATTSVSISTDFDIFNANIVGGITSPAINLTSFSGDIGSVGSRLAIDTTDLTANANGVGGDVYINAANGVNLAQNFAGSGADGAFEVTTLNGDLTSSGPVAADTVVLISSANITLGADVAAGTSATLTAANNITNAALTAVSAPLVTLTATNGSIGTSAASRFRIDATNLAASTANGSAFIDELTSVNVNSGVANGAFDLRALTNITSSGAISASNVSLEATNGSLTLAALVTGTTSINLTSNATINDASVTGGLASPQINLVSTANNIVVTTVDFTNVTANAFGSVNLIDANGLNLGGGASTAGATFTVIATTGNLTSTGTINATGYVSLTASAAAGAFDLDGSVTSATGIGLLSGASIADANISGGLFSNVIDFQSSTGSIAINTVNLINVSANAATSAVLNDTTGSMNIGGSTSSVVGTTFTATAPVDLTSTSGLQAGTSVSLIATAGSFDLDGLVDSPIISLQSQNSILNTSISGGLTTAGGAVGQLNLVSVGGDIGALGVGGALGINANNLVANAPAGSVFINDTAGPLTINGASGALDVFVVTAVGNLTSTVAGTITADAVNLTTTGGFFDLDGAVNGTTSIALTATNNLIIDADITGGLNTPTLILTAQEIGAGSADRLDIDVDNLVATATAGGVYVADSDSLNINTATATGNIDIVAANNLSSSGLVSAGNDAILRATAGSLQLDGETRAVGTISLQSSGSILNGNIAGGLTGTGGTAPVANLVLRSDNGDIGASLGSLTFDAINLTANAPTGNIFVYDDGSLGDDNVNINGASAAAGAFELIAENNVTSGASITGDLVFLNALAGSFTLGGSVNATTLLSMASAGAITDASVTGGLVSPQIDLVSSAGLINLSTVNFTSVTAISATSSVTLVDANGFNIGLGASQAATTFTATATTGNLTSTGTISAVDVNLTATAGTLDLDGAVSGTTSISLTSSGAIVDASVTGGLTSSQINLNSTAANIALTTVDFTNVRANANTSVSITDFAGSMNFGGGASSAGTTFTAVAPTNLTSTSSITAAAVDLTATAGGFDLDGLVRGTTSIKLTSANSIVDSSITGGLDSGIGVPVALLDLTSTSGDIGSLLDFLNINANVLRANAPAGGVFIEDVNSVTIGGGTSGALTAFAVLANDDLTVSSPISAAIVSLAAINDISLGANVTGTTAVTLNAGATLVQTAGLVSGGALSVDFGGGAATLSTDVASLTTVGDAEDLVINEANNITLLSQVVDSLNVTTAGTGNISTGADISLIDIVLTTTNGGITINNNLTATNTVTLDTSAGAGSIEQIAGTQISTPSLSLESGAGGIGTNGNVMNIRNGAAGAMTVFAQATGGDVFLNYTGTGQVSLSGSTGNNDFSVSALTGSIRSLADIDGDGQLTLTTTAITNSNTFDFDTIVVNTPGSGSNLTISGTGGFFNSENGTTFTVIEGNMTFAGSTTFGGNGDATLTVQDLGGVNNFFTVNLGVAVVGQNRLTVNACDLVLTGSLSGNPLVVNCADAGTIANNNGTGDVNLTGNVIFNGGPFAILASGNINTAGATLIDLTGTTNGGNLTLMAGVTFTPVTPGQTQNADTYTLTGFSTQGGSINLSTVNILTVGNNGNGGAVTAIASNGLTNTGSVALGNIDTSGTATSGQIRVIGAGGISIGDVDTTGGITSGNVNLAVASPVISGTIFVQDGVVSGGSFTTGAARNGNISVGNITAPGRDVTFLGALGAADTITQNLGTTIASNKLIVNTGVGTATFASTNVAELNTTGGGAISLLSELNDITLNGVNGIGQDVVVNAGGAITVAGTGVNVDQLSLTGNSGAGNAIVINSGTLASDITLTASTGSISLASALTAANTLALNSAGGITQGAGVVSASALTLSFGTSPVTLSTNVGSLVTLTAGTLTINEANDITLGNQAVTALTVTSAIGDIFTSADFLVNNLTLTATAGAIGITNDITATNAASLTAADGMTTTLGGSLTTNLATLSSTSTIGADASNRFNIVANTMQVTNAQNAFVNNSIAGSIVLNNSAATGTLDIVTTGDLTGAGTATAANLSLATGGKFALTGALTGTTTLRLTADDNIVNADLTGTLTTPSLTLTSVSGTIGVDGNNPFTVAATIPTISGNALSATGSVFIRSLSTAGVNFGQSSAGNDLSLASAGALTVTGDLTSVNGDLSVNGTGGILTIGDNTTLTAFSSILINNTTSNKKDKLILGAGSTIATNAKIAGLGDVTIALGPSILGPGGDKTPKFTTVNESGGGTVSFSGKKAKGFSPQNTFNAIGADVLVSNNLKNNAMEIRGGVTVTADPPVPVGTPVYVSYGKGSMHGAAATTSANSITSDAFAGELISAAPVVSTADMQLVSLNNALGTNNLFGGQGSLSATTGDASSNLATVSQNNLAGSISRFADDSFITTNAPSAMNFDVKVCSDVELGIASAANGVSTMPHSSCVTMDNGSVLFVAAKDMTVVSPKGKVKLAAGAIALVVADADHLSVYDVNDQHKRSVEVEVGGRSIPLSPGRHVTVTHNKIGQFNEINAVEAMMHRHVGSHELGNGHKAFTTEFSLPGAIEVLKPLKAMIKSNNTEAQKVAQKVFKTSAIVMQLSQGGASYEFHAKPKTVALNW